MRRSANSRSCAAVRLIIIGLISLVGVGAVPARALGQTALQSRLAGLVGKYGGPGMRVGVRVERLNPPASVIYDHHGSDLFKPASNQKLVTSAAALCMLPSDFRYRTILARRGRDLIIIGAGDPSCGDPRLADQAGELITAMFHRWAEALQKKGITRIEGDLLFDDFIFEREDPQAKWPMQKNLAAWYTAPVGGLNFNDNCVDVVIKRGAKTGAPAEVQLIPNTPWVQLDNKAVTGKKGQPLVRRVGQGPLTISVSGSVSRSNSADNPLSIAIIDPGEFFASTARTCLAAKGIQIVGQTRREKVHTPGQALPAGVEVIAVHETRIGDFLWRVNKKSMNMFAEGLFKTVGAYERPGELPQQGNLENSQRATGSFLKIIGLKPEFFKIVDGCGLSHANRIAPIVLTTVLRHMDSHAQRELWWSSLAQPGEKAGTLVRRMKELRGKVFAKTGYINGVSSLSGYVFGPGGVRYAFSVLCNDTHKAKGGTSAARQLQEEICRTLANAQP